MIRLSDGTEWGTAAECAMRLGDGVSRAMVRFWVRERGLTVVRVGAREVRYLWSEVAEVEAAVRGSGKGRKRSAA